jgi:hypothetical protein
VAVSLSEKGSEAGTVYVFDVATGKKHMDAVPRVQFPTAGGSVVWNHDGSGFFYTRYPAPGERAAADARFYQQVYFHQLGTAPDQDRYEIGREFPRIAETDLKRVSTINTSWQQFQMGTAVTMPTSFATLPENGRRSLDLKTASSKSNLAVIRSTSNGPRTIHFTCFRAKTRHAERF